MVSLDRLRAPLSSRALRLLARRRVGPAVRATSARGGEVTIADGTGSARIDLGGAVIFIRSDNYHEMVGPDWALHLETSLAQGDQRPRRRAGRR